MWLALVFAWFAMAQLAPAESLRVMSFNVRYPNPEDGADIWEKRRDLLVDVIRHSNPDVLGTQELFKTQGDYIVERLPTYAWFGVSRRGNERDEYMGVFYRKDRLRVLDQGNFWLSETPDRPGSQSWDMSLPRMVTWGLFETRSKRRFYLLNTHFAHRPSDEQARLNSAEVLLSRMKKLHNGIPVIVTGDFNASAGGPVHAAMLAGGLKDTRALAAKPSGPDDTFHGFRGTPRPGRIDWILAAGDWKVISNQTLTDNLKGRYPSDHFPILVELEFAGEPLPR